MKKLFLLAVVVLGFTFTTFAQIKTGSSGSVTVPLGGAGSISPAINVSWVSNLNLGTVTNSSTGGTVRLWPAGGIQTGGGVTTSAITGTAATFKITGANILPTVDITPLYSNILNAGSVSVGRFDIVPASDCNISPNGTYAHEYIVQVGGTLTLNANATGSVTIPGVTITVNNQ